MVHARLVADSEKDVSKLYGADPWDVEIFLTRGEAGDLLETLEGPTLGRSELIGALKEIGIKYRGTP